MLNDIHKETVTVSVREHEQNGFFVYAKKNSSVARQQKFFFQRSTKFEKFKLERNALREL